MKTEKVDLLNIGLMLLSMTMALFLPFELFLFVYAVLGPLHYLTEINWLQQKNYFFKYRMGRFSNKKVSYWLTMN